MTDISIIIPHKRTQLNNEALELNIAMLADNTEYSYELIVDTEAPKDPYKIWNEAAVMARSDILVFSNSDVLMAPSWDTHFIMSMEYNAIVTGYLIEAGNIGVANVNIRKDFGKKPTEFRRKAFEDYVAEIQMKIPKRKDERGWYMPCAIRKDWFLSTGGFDTTLGFPNPNDILFWDRCIRDYGTKLIRVASFAYHFQALSTR